MSNILIVVYSWTGTSHRLAEAVAVSRRWTLAEVSDARAGRTAWRCILDSLLRRRPSIRYDGPDPSGFDAVVLMSPIWAGRLAGPMRSFVSARAVSLPPVVMVSVMGGDSGASAALAEASQLLPHAPIVAAVFTQREIDDGLGAARLEAFGDAIESALKSAPHAVAPDPSARLAAG